MKLVLLSVLLVSEVGAFLNTDDLTVNTTNGFIKGFNAHIESVNKDVFKFLGVPFALPPTGTRRFLPSQPMSRHPGIFNASAVGSICPQEPYWVALISSLVPGTTASEDCLTLNIYVPANALSDGKSMATIIFVHGGYMQFGSSSVYDGSLLATIGEVIVVTINYRLGVLGFLTNEEGTCVGNFGLWDQRLAMQWVKSNVQNFGGDPSRVTLAGESSGSITSSIQTLLPKNVGLFSRVISQSGSALIPGAMVDRPKPWFNLFSTRINCNDDKGSMSSEQTMACLRGKSYSDIVNLQVTLFNEASKLFMQPAIAKLQFGPWVDGDLIPLEPAKIIQHLSEGRLNMTIPMPNLDMILGVNSQEGATFYIEQLKSYKKLHGINATFDVISEDIYNDFVHSVVGSVTGNNRSAFADMYEAAIDHEYKSTNKPTDVDLTKRFTDVLSDLTFNMGVISFARVHASFKNLQKPNQAKTFFYFYDHRGSWKSRESWRSGADHGDELDFVFGLPYSLGLGSTSGEKSLSFAMITLWSNFAKTGDPNQPTPVQIPARWPQFTVGTEDYLLLRDDYTSELPVGRQLLKSRIYFWTDYFPRLTGAAPKNCNPSN